MQEKPLRVLIIEDSEHDEQRLQLELRRAGYRAETQRVEALAAMVEALQRP